MFRFFDRNAVGAYLLLPVLLVLLRLRLILYPTEGFIAQTDHLYTPLWYSFFGTVGAGGWASITLSILFTIFTAYSVSSLVNRFHFGDHQSLASGLFFILFTSGYVISQGLHPVHVFTWLLLIAIYRLFAGVDSESPMRFCFESSMMFSLGVMLWGKGVWFIPVYFAMVIFLRMFSIRSFIAILMGFSVPVIVSMTWYLYHDCLVSSINAFLSTMTTHIELCRTGMYTRTYLGLFVTIILWGTVNTMGEIAKLKIAESRCVRSVVVAIIAISLFVVLPYFSLEIIPAVALGGSIVVSTSIMRIRNNTHREIVTLLVVAATVFIQWKIKGT